MGLVQRAEEAQDIVLPAHLLQAAAVQRGGHSHRVGCPFGLSLSGGLHSSPNAKVQLQRVRPLGLLLLATPYALP